MKKIFFGTFIICALMASCNAPTPINHAEDLEHDEADRVELIFTPGELAQDNIENNVYGQGFTADNSKETLTINYQKDEETGAVSLDKVEGLAFKPNQWYALQVNLYNHAGANINKNISTFPEQVAAHQFYFRHLVEIEGKNENMNDKYITYRYGDLGKDGKLVMPPLGFIGYVKFGDQMPKNSKLNVILVHLVNIPKTQAKGKPYPFYAPPAAFIHGADVNYKFPITIQ